MTLVRPSQLFHEAAKQAASVVQESTVPLFRRVSDHVLDFEGSGLLVRLARGYEYLFSAGHVFRNLTDGIFLLSEGRETKALANHAVCIRDDTAALDKEQIDVGYVRLTPEEVGAIGGARFLSASLLAPLEARGQTPAYFLLGYPEKFQIRDFHARAFKVGQIVYDSLEAKPQAYAKAGLSRNNHVMVRYDRNRTVTPTGTGGSPSLKGLSGGGVWRLDPLRLYSHASPPELVAVTMERPRRFAKSLLGTRIGLLLAFLIRDNPEIEGVVALAPEHSELAKRR